jgi:hypothetical protein
MAPMNMSPHPPVTPAGCPDPPGVPQAQARTAPAAAAPAAAAAAVSQPTAAARGSIRQEAPAGP